MVAWKKNAPQHFSHLNSWFPDNGAISGSLTHEASLEEVYNGFESLKSHPTSSLSPWLKLVIELGVLSAQFPALAIIPAACHDALRDGL